MSRPRLGHRPRSTAVASDLGRPQVLVNSAGSGVSRTPSSETSERWSAIISVNLNGTFLMCRAALPYLLEGGGAIVNVASNAGLMGQPYSARVLRVEGRRREPHRARCRSSSVKTGVRVNAVAPGGMNTPMMPGSDARGRNVKEFAKVTSPLGVRRARGGRGLIACIASDDARYMTGSIVSFDGGITREVEGSSR